MTQVTCCHCRRCALSNHYDRLLAGLAGKGSAFFDTDSVCRIAAVTHRGASARFLFQELKNAEESLAPNILWALRDLSWPHTVWIVRYLARGRHELTEVQFGAVRPPIVLTDSEYQTRFLNWWNGGNPNARNHGG
jgi:hypothetical protein